MKKDAPLWWVIGLRGLCALLFGLAALAWPGAVWQALVAVAGVYLLMEGILTIAAGIRLLKNGWGAKCLVTRGALGAVLGIVAIFWAQTVSLLAVVLMAAWAILTGVVEVAFGLEMRRQFVGDLRWIISGVVWIVCGAALLVRPQEGMRLATVILGLGAVAFGMLALSLAARLRRHQRQCLPLLTQ